MLCDAWSTRFWEFKHNLAGRRFNGGHLSLWPSFLQFLVILQSGQSSIGGTIGGQELVRGLAALSFH